MYRQVRWQLPVDILQARKKGIFRNRFRGENDLTANSLTRDV